MDEKMASGLIPVISSKTAPYLAGHQLHKIPLPFSWVRQAFEIHYNISSWSEVS
jgi:hypothetical protein